MFFLLKDSKVTAAVNHSECHMAFVSTETYLPWPIPLTRERRNEGPVTYTVERKATVQSRDSAVWQNRLWCAVLLWSGRTLALHITPEAGEWNGMHVFLPNLTLSAFKKSLSSESSEFCQTSKLELAREHTAWENGIFHLRLILFPPSISNNGNIQYRILHHEGLME